MTKKLIISSIIALSSLGFSAQEKSVAWLHNFGGSANEEALSVITANDGGNLISGYSYSEDGLVSGNNGWQDGWLLKTNAHGMIEWQKHYGGNGADVIESIKEVSNGYLIAGWSSSTGNDFIDSHGLEDGFISKLDQEGNVIWIESLGGSSMDKFFDIEINSKGEILALGYTLSNDHDISYNDPKGQLDIWLVKFSSKGQLIWQRNFGGSDDDFAYDLTIAKNDELLIAGSSNSIDGQLGGNNKGDWDFWILSVDDNGNLNWSNSYGYAGKDEAKSILVNNDNIFAIGSSNSSDRFDSHGSSDAWVLKLDLFGNYIEEYSFGSENMDLIHSSIIYDDHIILAGETKTNDRQDGWLLSLSFDGAVTSSQLIGGSEVDIINDLTINNGALIIAGTSSSHDGDMNQNFGKADVLAGSIGGITQEIENGDILVFPNPATETVNLVLNQIGIEWVKIYNTSGQIIYSQNGNNFFQEQISVSEWPSGIYLVEALSHQNLIQKRFIKL